MRSVPIAGGSCIALDRGSQVAGESQMSAGKVSGIIMSQRANDGQLVTVFRKLLKMLANKYAGRACGNRLKFAADFLGSIRLRIERIDLARATQANKKMQRFAAPTAGPDSPA